MSFSAEQKKTIVEEHARKDGDTGSPEVQVAFNLAKGSLPIRGDIDMSAANDCMQKGLGILASGNILPSGDMNLTPDTQGQIEDLMVEFWNNPEMSADEAQAQYADIIANAD